MQDFNQEPRSFGIKFIDVTHLKPLAFASKTLTPTKQHCANTKRDMLGVIFGFKKFKYYSLNHNTLILSDHKPLSSITSKDYRSASPHLQHMLLRLQRFSFEIHYRKGSNIILTDHLSHNIPLINSPERTETTPGLDHILIALISKELNVSQNCLDRMRGATQYDLNMQALQVVIIEGDLKINQSLTHLYRHSDFQG